MSSDIILPENKYFTETLGHNQAWSDHYGALHVAAKYCNINESYNLFNGIWQHGCFGPWYQEVPQLLVYNAPKSQKNSVFVARKDEEELLKKNGFMRAKAIGLPFVYVDAVDVDKVTNSLLVVPTHTLSSSTPLIMTEEMLEYVDYIHSISNKFSKVIACIHPLCKENGLWIKQFKAHGIECVTGAATNDKNALKRIKVLFSMFEYVTTNSWGSHVPYALSCGAKVSIIGNWLRIDKKKLLKDTGYGGNANIVDIVTSNSFQKEKNKLLSHLFVSPECGIKDVEFGKWLIGDDNKLAPKELIKAFKWSYKDRIFYRLNTQVRHKFLAIRSNISKFFCNFFL